MTLHAFNLLLYVSDLAYSKIDAFDYSIPCHKGEGVVSLFQVPKIVGMRHFPYAW